MSDQLLGPAFDTPEFYLGDPNATFQHLRRTDPLHWYEAGNFWVVTKYDDIKAISAHPDKFSSERIGILNDLVAAREGHDPQGYRTRGIMFMDPPVHRQHRRAVGPHFTPGAVAKLEHRVREIVHEVFDQLPDGEFDWIERVAEPIPVYVFAHLLGVPEQDWSKVASWATTIANTGSGQATDADYAVIFDEIGPYLMELVADRTKHPVDDLLTMLTTTTIDGAPFDDMTIMVYALTLLAAGSETTQSLIAGIADCLDRHPAQADKLFDDPTLCDNTTEEVLRYWTPVMSMARQAIDPIELRGKQLRPGDGLLLAYASANRDADHWGPSANDFDVTRADAAGHLGFGIGEHFCLGAALARREARLLLLELTSRAKGLSVTGERVPRRSALVNTYDRLPVTLNRR